MSWTTHKRKDHLPSDGVIVIVALMNFFLTSSKVGANKGHRSVADHHPDAHTTLVA